jgi:uncharacterized protein (TIGR02117 family)
VLAACGASPPSGPRSSVEGSLTKVVYLVGHGWHVGIALARADVPRGAWPESDAFGARRFLEVGWGDGDFYPAPRGTVRSALNAAFSSDGSVLHVAAFDPPVAEFFAGATVIAVPVSSAGVAALSRFIGDAYARDAAGRAVAVAPGLYGDARFYRANGRYRLLDNSNTWTARALAIAGCPIDPEPIVTASGVLDAGRACRERAAP